MSKEVEALKRIETTFSMNKEGKVSAYRAYTNSIYPYYEDFDLVLNALNRLETIDNAEPSKALEILNLMGGFILPTADGNKCLKDFCDKEFDIIKQALLKTQAEHKALEIIKEKCVGNDNLLLVKEARSYKHYLGKAQLGIDNIVNTELEEKDLLTEEEFNVLKGVSGCTE